MLRRWFFSTVLIFFVVSVAAQTAPQPAQSTDDSQARPPVSKSDVEIVKRARQILNSPEEWNRTDNRICPENETKFSLYCALEKATSEVTADFVHRGAAMQEARFVIDNDLAPKNNYHHRLMDYNNDPHTKFSDVQRFFDFLQGRIEARLDDQTANPQLAAVKFDVPKVSQSDIAIAKKVEEILDLPAKWDRAGTQECRADANTFGLYCALKSASLAVTGRFDDQAPVMTEVRHLISRTAPNAAKYSARLVDYNNDPTVTFDDLQKLLKTVEVNLEKQVAVQPQ